MMPYFLGSILLGKIHAITYFMWSIYMTVMADLLHCGYDLPWYPWGIFPFGAGISNYDYHHSSNVGNYGAFSTFFDIFCGTNKHYINSIAKKEKNS